MIVLEKKIKEKKNEYLSQILLYYFEKISYIYLDNYFKSKPQKKDEKNLLEKIEAHTTAIMTKLGIPIYFSKGSQTNIKITTKEDLDMFIGYVLAQKYKSGDLKV